MSMTGLTDFNDTALRAIYSYGRSPVQDRSFLIYAAGDRGREPVPVGDYTVLDLAEDPGLSERKVMNIVSLLNGRKRLMQLGHETKSRVLYRVLPQHEDGQAGVIFYHLGNEGNSVENALFRIRDTSDED